jgi:hypothetical protein
MFGGSLWVLPTSSTTKTGHHDIAGILLIFTIIIRWNEYYFMKKGK